MSVIGPRPALWNQDVLIAEREKYNANDVKPGLTGWAQINGRDELEIPVKAKLDGEYVEKESLFFDIKCFLGTIGKVAKDDSVVEGGTGEMGKQEISEEIKENEKKKILVICQYYKPEPFRISDICEELVHRGHEVHVVTGYPNYPEGVLYEGYGKGKHIDEVINGVTEVTFKNNGKLKLLIIVGTRPEIIRLAAVIKKCRNYFDTILAHTGQNYDYNLNGVFFHDLELDDPDVYLNAVGADLGETMGNIISESYKLMAEIKPDAVLVLGDTNSCLSVIGAKRLHIPIFHMEAGNRCKDECLPEETNRRIVDIISDVNMAYSEHARRYLADCGLPKERTYVTGSPMAEVLHDNLEKIEASDVHARLGLEKGKYILLSAHREENIDTEKNFLSLFEAINKIAEKYDMPILYSCHPRSRKRLEASGFQLDKRVIQHEPLGFHDYNCLQMNAFAVVSDSGTLPEESSFFTSVGHPFPAVCIRTSTERPEALDKGCFVLAGIDSNSLVQAVETAVAMNENGDYGIPVPDYVEENVSTKVVKIIQSYTGVVNKMVWRKF